mmetsp:Transcript_11543/g.46715  ORF Transcript_11543/g.46715 Transcript_11543/m.46715 type:complete len:240 (+) Transcript_11543:1157-1876(+)
MRASLLRVLARSAACSATRSSRSPTQIARCGRHRGSSPLLCGRPSRWRWPRRCLVSIASTGASAGDATTTGAARLRTVVRHPRTRILDCKDIRRRLLWVGRAQQPRVPPPRSTSSGPARSSRSSAARPPRRPRRPLLRDLPTDHHIEEAPPPSLAGGGRAPPRLGRCPRRGSPTRRCRRGSLLPNASRSSRGRRPCPGPTDCRRRGTVCAPRPPRTAVWASSAPSRTPSPRRALLGSVL